jgi:uncharacterized protein (DUF2336 family)
MTGFIRRLLGGGADGKGDDVRLTLDDLPEGSLSYGDARRLARDGDPALRRMLAARGDVAPEILYYLADDPDAGVRRAIVNNAVTPSLAHLILAEDTDEEVRSDLAARVARLLPDLPPDARDRAHQAVHRVLERLARDQLARVRQFLSDALKDIANAPPEVIRRLARDVEEAVATPVLEFSPVLRDEDLLDIISERPSTSALAAISRRSRVAADVADAIAETDDTEAIAVLLANRSAQIREETLDMLIDRAVERPQWHEPLVQRPNLHREAAIRLARFVADRLIQVLVDRQDLAAETLEEVKRVVHRRLEEEGRPPSPDGAAAHPTGTETLPARARAGALQAAGALREETVTAALKSGDGAFVVAALSVASGVPETVIAAALNAASGRGVAAMVWKAGFSPRLSVQVQSRLARIPPREVVSTKGDDLFGLTDTEMDWQIEMFSKLAENGGL